MSSHLKHVVKFISLAQEPVAFLFYSQSLKENGHLATKVALVSLLLLGYLKLFFGMLFLSFTLTPPSSFKLTSSHLSCFLVKCLSSCCLSFQHGVISSDVIVSTCSTCLFVCSLGHASSHFTVAWLPPPPISLCDEAVTLNA